MEYHGETTAILPGHLAYDGWCFRLLLPALEGALPRLCGPTNLGPWGHVYDTLGIWTLDT
jgi:hypothetical protein